MHVDTEHAYAMAIRLAREEGILVGVSSGANMVAAMQVASELKGGVVVTIFCDSAAKYLSESFWQTGAVASVAAQLDAENWP
jgi:cysteine synthase B